MTDPPFRYCEPDGHVTASFREHLEIVSEFIEDRVRRNETFQLRESAIGLCLALARAHPEWQWSLNFVAAAISYHYRGWDRLDTIELLFQRIDEAGCSPGMYLYRPFMAEGTLSLPAWRDGYIALGDIIAANDVLDYYKGRGQQAPQQVITPSNTTETGSAAAIDLAIRQLENGEAGPPGRGRLTQIARSIAKKTGMTPESVRVVISPYVRAWEKEHTDR